MTVIIGRKEEQKVLQRLYNSRRAEFLAVYGRSRVGKTYLIKKFFSTRPCCLFQITGVKDGLIKDQLKEFSQVIEQIARAFLPLKEAG